MKNNLVIFAMMGAGLLALAAGCGKIDSTPSGTNEADKSANPGKAEPSPAIEKAKTETTNGVAPTHTIKVADTSVQPGQTALSEPVTAPAALPQAAQPAAVQPSTGLATLSQDQMVKGLREALAKGLRQAIANLGHSGGFLTNLNVKIPMPEKMQKVETTLRALRQDKLADDFVATMNHAAEQAVPAASGVFVDAMNQMSIEDAKSILTGPNDAATRYFQKTTQTNLYTKFYPIVQKATAGAGVTSAYKNLMEKANVTQSLGSFGSALGGALLDKDALDLDAYVTNKAMDGLFKMVADEEKQVRENPVARTTDTLQRVFGALTK